MDREVRRLPRDVPQRDVDDAERDRVDEVPETADPAPVATDVERILAKEQRLDKGDDLIGDRGRAGTGKAHEAPSHETLVGRDPQHAHRQLSVADTEHREPRPARVEDDVDVGDHHAAAAARGGGGMIRPQPA